MIKQRTEPTSGWSESAVITKSHPSIPNGTPLTLSQISYDNLIEDICYDTGFNRFNDCSHYKCTAAILRSSYVFSVPSTGENYYTYSSSTPSHSWNGATAFHNYGNAWNPFIGLPELGLYLNGQPQPPDVPELNKLLVNALENILPGIRPELSLVNSLIELKDFKSLPKLRTKLQNLAHLWDKSGPGKKTLKELLGVSADTYLQSEFNVKPVFSDLAGIYRAVASVRAQLERLYAQEHRYLTSHFRQSLSTLFPSGEESVTQSGLYQGCKFRRVYETKTALLHVTVDYAYNLRGVPKELALVDAFLDALGVTFNPSTIWNAIPWSFVVDWVLGVSRWLDQFRSRALDPKTIIYRCCYSIKVDRTVFCYLQNSLGGPVSSETPVSQVRQTSYHRRRFSPNLIASISSSSVNLKEFTLAGALGTSRIMRRRRR